MKLKFYGTRGSIPICDSGFQEFGGNTTCLQITFTDTNRIAIIDAGTSTASRLIRDWWSWRRARICWFMTRNTRPRNCRNGADGDTVASIKPCKLQKWPA